MNLHFDPIYHAIIVITEWNNVRRRPAEYVNYVVVVVIIRAYMNAQLIVLQV